MLLPLCIAALATFAIPKAFNWTKIMKTINDDPEGFFDDSGWLFLDPNSGDEAEDEDDAYNPLDSEYDDGDESGESNYSEEEESEDDNESCNKPISRGLAVLTNRFPHRWWISKMII